MFLEDETYRGKQGKPLSTLATPLPPLAHYHHRHGHWGIETVSLCPAAYGGQASYNNSSSQSVSPTAYQVGQQRGHLLQVK